MNVSEIKSAMRESCASVISVQELERFDGLTFDSYDPETKILALYAKDAMTAVFVSRTLSHAMIAALEELVDAPANIVCKYRAQFSPPHERFVGQREEATTQGV